jgi:DNA polymerase III subunit delta'
VIEIPGQPLAQRVLRAALAREDPPQQLLLHGPAGTGKRRAAIDLAWGLMDPDGAHERTGRALDLTIVEATGQQILLRDLEEALAQIASRPSVMRRRVMVVFDIERLRDQESRLLKTLEEPAALSTIVLVTDHPADLLDTIRSRCLPVPFRSPGWRHAVEHLEPFAAEMHRIGADLGVAALTGAGGAPGAIVAGVQSRMEGAAGGNPSEELVRLRAEAEALAGKRGERTAAKRAEDQEKRERRRMVTDGWTLVLDSAAAVAGDALALAVGASAERLRHPARAGALREVAVPERVPFLERAVEELQSARAELELNPRVELAAEALLVRLDEARHGAHGRLVRPGRLAW